MNEFKSSDVEDVRIAIVDGLKGCDAGDSAGGHGGLSASASELAPNSTGQLGITMEAWAYA